MADCVETKSGTLLHAYELGILDEPECDQFEIHLLQCLGCRTKLKLFASEISLIREVASEAETNGLSDILVGKHMTAEPRRQGRRSRSVWPALAATFFAMFVLAIVWPQFNSPYQAPREVQMVSLFQTRSGQSGYYEIVPGKDLLMCFSIEGATAESIHRVVLESVDGEQVFSVDRFSGHDGAGVAWLLVPAGLIAPADYVLVVSDTTEQSDRSATSFRFRLFVPGQIGSRN